MPADDPRNDARYVRGSSTRLTDGGSRQRQRHSPAQSQGSSTSARREYHPAHAGTTHASGGAHAGHARTSSSRAGSPREDGPSRAGTSGSRQGGTQSRRDARQAGARAGSRRGTEDRVRQSAARRRAQGGNAQGPRKARQSGQGGYGKDTQRTHGSRTAPSPSRQNGRASDRHQQAPTVHPGGRPRGGSQYRGATFRDSAGAGLRSWFRSPDRARLTLVALLVLAAGIWGFGMHGSLAAARQAQASAEAAADAAEASYQQVQADYEVVDSTDGDWTLHAKRAFSSSDQWSAIKEAVDSFQSKKGYECGLVLQDLDSGEYVSYNDDQFFYPASSIKAPFLCSLFEEEVEDGQVSLSSVQSYAQAVVLYSDNTAYSYLWHAYGPDCLVTWAQEAGVDDEFLANAAAHTYPRLSAHDMSLLWKHAYDYLSGGTEAAKVLAGYLDEPETTAIGTVAEKNGRTSWSKAGWFPDSEGNASPATADCGIIFDDDGPYLVCVLTTAPQDFDSLTTLIEALDTNEDGLS